MRANKNIQYGLLLCLYLARSGRCKLETVATNLGLSLHMLEQIARKLRLGGLISSTRGPGGGYTFNHEATVFELYVALEESPNFLKSEEFLSYGRGATEERALGNFFKKLTVSLYPMLDVKITKIGFDAVAQEVAQMNSVTEASPVN